ncbi:hypothetical protein B0H17DRAFT_1090840 [Mycena rosella]|uniref:Uncharacterized protein n=1 Tax=Mycena rosella TaxID=1033263 RepID=A0AAD7CV12_MYCRO|nr:hypothetical protein B0H17DRAFT_1090840 [Mycena rosella]
MIHPHLGGIRNPDFSQMVPDDGATNPIEPAQFRVGRFSPTVKNDNQTTSTVTTRLNPENCSRETCSASPQVSLDSPAQNSGASFLSKPSAFPRASTNSRSTSQLPSESQVFVADHGGQGYVLEDDLDVFWNAGRLDSDDESLMFAVAIRISRLFFFSRSFIGSVRRPLSDLL